MVGPIDRSGQQTTPTTDTPEQQQSSPLQTSLRKHTVNLVKRRNLSVRIDTPAGVKTLTPEDIKQIERNPESLSQVFGSAVSDAEFFDALRQAAAFARSESTVDLTSAQTQRANDQLEARQANQSLLSELVSNQSTENALQDATQSQKVDTDKLFERVPEQVTEKLTELAEKGAVDDEAMTSAAWGVAISGGAALRGAITSSGQVKGSRELQTMLFGEGKGPEGADKFSRVLFDKLEGIYDSVGPEEMEGAANAARSGAPAEVVQLVTTPEFRALPEREREAYTRLLSGNTRLSTDARFAAAALTQSQEYQQASASDRTRMLGELFRSHPNHGYPLVPFNPIAPSGNTATVGEPTRVEGFTFQEGMQPTTALRHEVTVNGHTVAVYVPENPDPSLPSHSLEDVTRNLAAMSPGLLATVNEVRICPERNPADPHWAQVYNDPDFESYMTAGADGVIRIYPVSDNDADMPASFVHEAGHIVSQRAAANDPQFWSNWDAAVASDLVWPSGYSHADRAEDFSETLVLYQSVVGTPQEAEIRALMPQRFAILDRMMRSRTGTGTASRG